MNSVIDLTKYYSYTVTHRKSSIKDCDRVIEIRENKIIYR